MAHFEMSAVCKLCSLIKKDPDLFQKAHEKVFNYGNTYKEVCSWLNAIVEEKNNYLREEELPWDSYSQANFTSHFKRHIKNPTDLKIAFKRLEEEAYGKNRVSLATDLVVSEGFSREDQLLANASLDQNVERLKDFLTLKSGVEGVQAGLLKVLDKLKTDSAYELSIDELKSIQRSFKEIVDTKKVLYQMLNSEAVAGAAIEAAIKELVITSVTYVKDISGVVRDLVQQELPRSEVPSKVYETLTNGFNEFIVRMASETSDIVKRRFGIK